MRWRLASGSVAVDEFSSRRAGEAGRSRAAGSLSRIELKERVFPKTQPLGLALASEALCPSASDFARLAGGCFLGSRYEGWRMQDGRSGRSGKTDHRQADIESWSCAAFACSPRSDQKFW